MSANTEILDKPNNKKNIITYSVILIAFLVALWLSFQNDGPSKFPKVITTLLYAFDFFFFRLYTWMIIDLIINHKNDYHNIIKKLTVWMKIQLYIFLLFLLLIYCDVDNGTFSICFGLLYTPSLIMALYMTYKTRKLIN